MASNRHWADDAALEASASRAAFATLSAARASSTARCFGVGFRGFGGCLASRFFGGGFGLSLPLPLPRAPPRRGRPPCRRRRGRARAAAAAAAAAAPALGRRGWGAHRIATLSGEAL